MSIRYVLDGGSHDRETGECDDVGIIWIEGKSYHRINCIRGGHWVFVPAGGAIPPGKMWMDRPYRPAAPADECPDLDYDAVDTPLNPPACGGSGAGADWLRRLRRKLAEAIAGAQ